MSDDIKKPEDKISDPEEMISEKAESSESGAAEDPADMTGNSGNKDSAAQDKAETPVEDAAGTSGDEKDVMDVDKTTSEDPSGTVTDEKAAAEDRSEPISDETEAITADADEKTTDSAVEKEISDKTDDTSAASEGNDPHYETPEQETDVSLPVRNKKKRSKAIHLAWIIPAAAAGIFAGVVFGGSGPYNERYWKDTYFGDMYVGGKTVDEVNQTLRSDNKELKITTREGNIETIALDDINYKSSFSTDIQAIKDSQSPFAWFLHNSGENVYDVDINTTYDQKALEDKLAGLDCIISDSIQDPTDAHLALVGDSFTIVEATEGNRINSEKLNSAITQAVKSGVFDVNLSDTDCYVTPSVYSDDADLNTTLNNINALKNNTVKLNLHDAEETIDYSIFKDWIHTEGTKPVLDDELMIKYLDGIAEKYNTFRTERDFNATGIGTIKVGGGSQDSYGFLLDEESTKDAIKEAILSGKSDTVDCYWTVPANHRNTTNGDIGNTYVEIDISRQHMWYYINGELFTDTDVRTGTESSAQWTPTTEGVYRILWKQRDKWFLQVGDPCHTDYWMPFNSRGEGIHDATWYSTYGGNLYKWAGSHGCINTPYSIAQLIYENIEAGTPVIVYRS